MDRDKDDLEAFLSVTNYDKGYCSKIIDAYENKVTYTKVQKKKKKIYQNLGTNLKTNTGNDESHHTIRV